LFVTNVALRRQDFDPVLWQRILDLKCGRSCRYAACDDCDRNAPITGARSPPARPVLFVRVVDSGVGPESERSPVLFELGKPTKETYGTYFVPYTPKRRCGAAGAH
jgi:hypothetical protein